MPGSITINDDEEVAKEEKETEDTFDKNSEDFKKSTPPENEAVQASWHAFAKEFQETHPELKSLLMLLTPSVNQDLELEVEVKNPLQKDKIEGLQSRLISFMRNKLDNRFLVLKVIINAEKQEEIKPVGPAEKLKFLAEKNNHLIELQKKFGLEAEY